jgi:hypothetical protein
MIPGTQAVFKLIIDRTTRIKPRAEIVSRIGTIESRGHAPGHMSILIASNGEQALVIGEPSRTSLSASRTPTGSRAMGFDRVIDDSAIVLLFASRRDIDGSEKRCAE